MSEGEMPSVTGDEGSPAVSSSPVAPDRSNKVAGAPRVSPGNPSAFSSFSRKLSLEELAVQLARGVSEASTSTCHPEYLVAMPMLMSISSSGEASPCDLQAPGTLRACKGCQKAKTACSAEQRPCVRCTRLKIDCENDQPPVKTACTNCRRAKVKCHFRAGVTCTRCCRLGVECSPHVPGKRKRLEPTERAAERTETLRVRSVRPPPPVSTLLLDHFNAPPQLQALPILAQECEVREARAALEALQRQGGVAFSSQAAESLFSSDGSRSPPGSSPGALSAVMTLMMVREGLPWYPASADQPRQPQRPTQVPQQPCCNSVSMAVE